MRRFDIKLSSAVALLAALLMTGCSPDTQTILPDGAEQIRVAVARSAASGTYRDWDKDTDPTTMGVIGFADGTLSPYIYNNVEFRAPETSGAWTCQGTAALWSSYSGALTLDFMAYMPYQAGATLSKSGSTYTLTLTDVPGVSSQPYMVVSKPVRYTSVFGHLTPIPFQMDQLMTRFEFQFMLGEDMSDLRTFCIRNITMSQVPATATIRQTYTCTGEWAKAETVMSSVSGSKTQAEVSDASGILIGYNNTPAEYKSFPKSLYMLPFSLTEVTPKIVVTYDVLDQEGFVTRDATSEILLSEANFGTLGTVQSAHHNTVRIKIVPTRLHVLSDADQSTSGYLVVGEK